MSLSDVGSIASIASLVFTAWVIYDVRGLHHFYKRHLLLPQYIAELTRHVKNARKALDAKRTEELKAVLRKCDAILERLPKYGDSLLKDRARTARTLISQILVDGVGLLGLSHDVISHIEATIESAKAFTGDDRWSTRA